jgi:hypothetical protein
VVIQFMIMGRGLPSEYPTLIRRMAQIIPPSDPSFSGIWAKYTRNRSKIAAKADRKMPTVVQLKGR